MIFAALVIERPPLEWSGFLGAVGRWLQDAGLYALLWLVILGLAYVVVPEFKHRCRWGTLHTAMFTLFVLASLLFGAFLVLLATTDKVPDLNAPRPTDYVSSKAPRPMTYNPNQSLVFSLAGLAALAACLLPIVRDLFQKRIVMRRIWAIARVAVKEAWSRGIVWVCVFIPIIYLYADWYISAKPEDQLRNRVGVVYFSLTVLFLLTSALLGAFSIPADLKNQNIFTIVTKPVERYEIVLGRFLGYALLILAELVVLTVISYFYVDRGLAKQAQDESYHARVPLFGTELYFHNSAKREEAENVGREWSYRSYISGIDPKSPRQRVQYAIWPFDAFPPALVDRADDDPVRLEFSFDIYRTTTGQEGKGVFCSFTFARGDLSEEQVENLLKPSGVVSVEYNDLYGKALKSNKASGKSGDELNELNAKSKKEIYWTLFEKYGVHQLQGVIIEDYHTQVEEIPAKVFKTLNKIQSAQAAPGGEKRAPVMRLYVNVENDRYSRIQRVGMAKADLYLLVEDRPFWINFFKGTLCIYLIACIVLGLSVVASSYLSGIISLLFTTALCLAGLFLPFIKSMADGNVYGGGPMESMWRLSQHQTASVQLDKQRAVIDVILKGDAAFRQVLRFMISAIPDVGDRYPSDYVANGFDITWGQLLFLNNILPVVGFLVPWAVLAYYLIKSREMANP